MTSAETGMLIVAVIGALAGTAFVIQGLENQRQQKKAVTQAIRSEIRTVQELLDGLKGPFMTETLYRFLHQYMLLQWKRLLELDRSPQAQNSLQACQQAMASPPATYDYPAGSLTLCSDRAAALKATSAIKLLAKWLNGLLKQSPQTNRKVIHEQLNYAKICYEKLKIEGMLFDAIECEQTRGSSVALHQYRSCLNALEKLDYRQQLDRQLYELRTHMDNIAAPSDHPASAKLEQANTEHNDPDNLPEASSQDKGKHLP